MDRGIIHTGHPQGAVQVISEVKLCIFLVISSPNHRLARQAAGRRGSRTRLFRPQGGCMLEVDDIDSFRDETQFVDFPAFTPHPHILLSRSAHARWAMTSLPS